MLESIAWISLLIAFAPPSYRDRRIHPSAEDVDHEYCLAADCTLLQLLRIMGVFQCRTKDEQNRNGRRKREEQA